MARLSPLGAGLALFVIFTFGASADDKCRSGCQGVTPHNFKYADGTTYKYNFESNLDISLSSAEGQQSTTKVKATVLLTQQPQCNQVLRLQNVQVIGADGKKHGTIPDLEKAIRLNFHDGHMEDIICTEHGDTQNSLNIKRAVASLFQASLNHHHETDVFGVCPTEIQTQKDGNTMTITKTRILNRCSHRENVKYDFMATAFNLHSEIKSSPILKSDYTSEQRVKDGILDHVIVTENYLYMPFSVGKNGAKATVQTKLQFVAKNKDAPKNKITEPRSIIFENPHPTISQKSDVSTILQSVKDTSNSIGITVGDSTAGKFAGLIKILNAAKKDDLLTVYNQIKSGAGFTDKAIAKKVFLDALFRSGTGECLEVAIELLKNKELSAVEQKLVYLGMTFVRHATPNSMTAATTLLDMPNLPREAYLGIGTLAARYCKSHDCKNVDQLNKLTQKLLSKLKDGKAANRQQEDETIAVLKALTNMKHLTDPALPKIVAIAQDKKASTRLRIAALEAYESDGCKDKLRDSAISILKDIQQDSEIRIKAYLALVKCPNGKVANAVKAVLDNEPSYQVGGFIVSHIRNLRASANPDKELAKRELANINTMKRFPVDPRKYSFNNEFSYAFDTLGMSSSVENNVIYSQNSYLPRSACVNLTTEIFGYKFNFLEVDTRQENLDKVIEHYMGPLGVLRNNDPQNLLDTGKASAEKIASHIRERFAKTRGKRHTPKAEMDLMAKQTNIKTNELNSDLDLDMSVKLFGSEFLFLSINENAQKYTPEMIIDKLFDAIDSGVDKVKDFSHDFHSNALFMDTDLSYPTSMGFPLRLAVEGTSTTQLKTSGNIDLHAILGGNKNHIFKLSLIPSANIELSGRMVVDAGIIENGLKVVSTLHTATGSAATLEFFNDGKGVDMKFSLPIGNQEILSAKHEIVFSSREAGSADVNTPIKFVESKDFSICFDHLSPLIGLSGCAELNGPNYQLNQGPILPFPFSGNSKFKVFIEKDENLVYHLRDVIFDAEKKTGFEFVLETLADNGQRKVSLLVEGYLRPEMFVKVTLDSPIKKAEIEGRIIFEENERSASAKFSHDNQEYSGKIGVAISGNSAKATYTPLIEYKTPQDQGVQKSPYTVEGSITAETSGADVKYTFNNVKLVYPDQKPITISGHLGKKEGGYYSDVTIGDGTNSGSLKGNMKASRELIKIDAEMKNSMSPVSNFHIDYELKRNADEKLMSSDLTLVHGEDLKSKVNKFSLKNSITNKSNSPNREYRLVTKNKMSYPLMGVEAQFDFTAQPKLLKYDIEGKYNNIKLGSEMDLKYNQKEEGDYDFDFELTGFDNKVKAKAKREITGEKSKIENSVEVNGKKSEANGIITHKIKTNDINVGAQMTFKCPLSNDVLTVDHDFTYIPHDVKTHLKVSKPGNTYMDFELNANKEKGANGHIKADVPEILKADGEIKADKWTGKAFIVFDLLKAQRKLKFDSTFTLTAPTYNVAMSIYPNFEKEPKKVTIISNNKIEEHALESKNELDAFGEKLEINFGGTKEGSDLATNGKMTGEFDVTLPNQMYLGGKINREVRLVDGVGSGTVFITLEQRDNKNTPGRKASLKGVAKDINIKERLFDLTYNLVFDDSKGKTLNADWIIKRNIVNEAKHIDFSSKMTGTVLQEPIEYSGHSEYKNFVGKYEMKSSIGGKANVALNGKYDLSGGENPLSGAFDFDMTTTNPKLKSVKMSAAGSVLKNDNLIDMSGNTKLFVDDDGSTPDALVDIAADGAMKLEMHSGNLKGSLKFQKVDPVSLAMSYTHHEENDSTKCHCDGFLQYANDKTIKVDFNMVHPNKNEWDLDMKLETPFENAKLSKIQQHFKKSEDNKQFTSDITLEVDSKKYVLNEDIIISDVSPLFKMELVHPDGKTDKLKIKINKPGGGQFSSEVSAVFNKEEFHYDGSLDAKINGPEDFKITLKVDCPKLKLEKIVLEAKNQATGGAKVVEIEATSNGNNVLKGSCNYKTHEEGSKRITEGSGEFTVKDKKMTGNFKVSKQHLSIEKNGEVGVEITFDAGLGNKAVDSEFKMTNKQFRILNSYCEEKKQCAHIEVDLKTNKMDLSEESRELEVNVDLRKLGLAHEFGLKWVLNRKDFHFDHTMDVHFQSQENNKYQYSFYYHPGKAGASLTTPKRQVSVEGHIDVPTKGKNVLKGELALYLNKKAEPTKKTAISASSEYTGDTKTGAYKAEAKFTTPGLTKDLSVSYNSKYNVPARTLEFTLIMDVFNKPNHKIIATGKNHYTKNGDNGQYSFERHATLKSQGLALDVVYDETTFSYDVKTHTYKSVSKLVYNLENKKSECMVLFEFSPEKYHSMVKLLDKELFNIESKLKMSKEAQVVDTKARIYGLKPFTTHFELKNFNTLAYKINYNEKVFLINAGFIPGQIADFRAEVSKNELAHASVKLDEANFLKPDYAMSTENIQKLLLEPAQKEFSNMFKESKQLVNDAGNDASEKVKHIGEVAKKNLPNLKPVNDYFTSETQKIREEFVADKTIQEVSEFLKNLFGATAKAVSEFLKKIGELNEQLMTMTQANFAKITELVDREVIPKFKEIGVRIIEITNDLFESFSKFIFTIFGKFSEFLDSHQAELKQLATSISTIAQDIGRFMYMNYERVRNVVTENVRRLFEELKALPIYEELKARYEMILKDFGDATEPAINVIKDTLNTLKDIVPNEDAKKLITLISDYIEKKIRNEKVDDIAALENIARNFILMLKKITKQFNIKDIKMIDPSTFSINYLYALPKLVLAKFSPFSYLTQGALSTDTLQESLYGVTFNPRSWIPPFRMYAFIVQGQHIFTFDGKHVTFPGKCNYLLARDAVNGNFSLAGTYTNGLLTAITFADKTDSITLKKGGQAMANKDASELPIRRGQTEAFRLYDSVHIVSKTGVEITCDPQLVVCTVSISGFYHGQLRGLLGNGNNEPYDDFTMANGKIVTSESDFGNSFKMTPSCAAIKTVDHTTHNHVPSCTKLFDSASSLRFCYPFVNTANFRMACDHGMASGVKDTEYAVAKGYVAACNAKFIPVRLPEEFVKCKNSEQPMSIGEKFSVKLPGKAADIILIVDQEKVNEQVYKELVQPLVADITKELAAKGMNDVEFHLIGYGGEYQKYPSHYTNGGKLSWKGKLPTIKFSTAPEAKTPKFGHKKIDEFASIAENIMDNIKLITGCDLKSRTYKESLKYPFRAHAAKMIIAFNSESCHHGKSVMIQKLKTFLNKQNNVHINVVSPIHEFFVKDAKVTKNIIAFNNENVFTFADAKKKPDGSSELYKDLVYDDYCAEYIVRGGGSVFLADNFVNAKGATRKQFQQQMTHNLVDQILSREQGADCECTYSTSTTGLNECKAVYTKEGKAH